MNIVGIDKLLIRIQGYLSFSFLVWEQILLLFLLYIYHDSLIKNFKQLDWTVLHMFFHSNMECSVLMWTSTSHQLLPRLRVHFEQYGAEIVRTGTGGVDDYTETFTRYFREFACSCDNRLKTWTSPKYKKKHRLERGGSPKFPSALCIWQLLWESVFLRL